MLTLNSVLLRRWALLHTSTKTICEQQIQFMKWVESSILVWNKIHFLVPLCDLVVLVGCMSLTSPNFPANCTPEPEPRKTSNTLFLNDEFHKRGFILEGNRVEHNYSFYLGEERTVCSFPFGEAFEKYTLRSVVCFFAGGREQAVWRNKSILLWLAAVIGFQDESRWLAFTQAQWVK